VRIGTAGAPANALQLTTDDAAKPTTSTWTVTSDVRTKRNLRPYADGLSVLRALPLQRWEFTGAGGTEAGRSSYGVTAQDLLTVLPEAVVTRGRRTSVAADSDALGFMGVQYHQLFVAGLGAIQQVDASVLSLEQRVAALEVELARLRAGGSR
jgi:hypothetical protein